MKIILKRPLTDILLCLLWSIILLPIALLNLENIIRIILGLPFLLFIPGYLLILILFPMTQSKTSIDTIERIALSFALSLAIVPIIGLVLNYTEWGLELVPILLSLFIFIFSVATIGLYRWHHLPSKEQVITTLTLSFPKLGKNLDSALTVILIASIIIALLSFTYVLLTPRTGKPFTEFYILGPEYKLEGYQTDLVIQENTNVIIGIANHEYKTITYTVEIWLLDQEIVLNKLTNKYELQNNHLWYIDKIDTTLEHTPANIDKPWTSQWEYNFSFNITKRGEFKLYFLLFTNSTEEYSIDVDYLDITDQKITSAYGITNLSLSVSNRPKIFDILATPRSTLQDGFVNISCSVFDADGIDEVYLNIRHPDYRRENFSITNNKTGLTYYCNRTYTVAGNYTYYIWSNDTTGNGSVSEVNYFLVTDIPKIPDVWATPQTTLVGGFINISCLVFDVDEAYEIFLNISYPDDSGENISIIGNQTGFIYYCNKTYNMIGDYRYYIWVNDTAGHINKSAAFHFSVTNYPKISNIETNPISTPQGGFVNISCLVYDPDGVTEVLLNIIYPNDTERNISITDNKTGLIYFYNMTYTIAGNYSFIILAHDTTGDVSKSYISQFVVTNYPQIFDIVATPPSIVQDGFVNISCSVFDTDGIKDVFLHLIYPDTTMENISITDNKTDDTYYFNQTYSLVGNYSYFIVAIDNFDYAQTSTVKTFSVILP